MCAEKVMALRPRDGVTLFVSSQALMIGIASWMYSTESMRGAVQHMSLTYATPIRGARLITCLGHEWGRGMACT